VDRAFHAKKIHAFVVENKTKNPRFRGRKQNKKIRAFVVRAYSADNSFILIFYYFLRAMPRVT
jgi:hypothetical protein